MNSSDATSTTPLNTTNKRSSSSAQSTAKKQKQLQPDPKSHLNRRVCKFFGEDETDLFFGVVTSYNEKVKFWHVDYDDGDEEEFDLDDVNKGIDLYARNKDLDPNRKKYE